MWYFHYASKVIESFISDILAEDRHVAPLGHIILIPSQLILALTPSHYVLTRASTNISFKVFGLTPPGLKTMIYCTWSEYTSHYTMSLNVTCSRYDIDIQLLNLRWAVLTNSLMCEFSMSHDKHRKTQIEI
jgi:hypothetical protein